MPNSNLARLCLATLALCSSAGAQLLGLGKPAAPVVIPTLAAPAPAYSFPQRQTLTFSVDWKVYTAGTAVFHLEQQLPAPPPPPLPQKLAPGQPKPAPVLAPPANPQLKITATADSVGSLNMIFPVIDKFQSGFDTRTGCSTGFSKQLSEGRRKVSSDLTFNYPAGKQSEVSKNLVKGTTTTHQANVPACVQDSLSAIFYVASQPLVVGQQVRFPLADSMRTVTVSMKVEGKEEIKTPAGTFQTVRVQPTAEEGIVKNRGTIHVWYTDDARHMPVQIRARLFWGTITFHLQSAEAK